jgi:hypothetical protein
MSVWACHGEARQSEEGPAAAKLARAKTGPWLIINPLRNLRNPS